MIFQEGSDSEQESYEDASQKHAGGKFGNRPSKGSGAPVRDLLQFQSAASSNGCAPLLKKKRTGKKECAF